MNESAKTILRVKSDEVEDRREGEREKELHVQGLDRPRTLHNVRSLAS
jgi:hypothetical protein